MTIKKLSKLPKRKITIDELLEADDITDLLAELYEKRHEVDQFILIYVERNGDQHNYWNGMKSKLVYSIEFAKHIMFSEQLKKEE
jgi:hypothetical protein